MRLDQCYGAAAPRGAANHRVEQARPPTEAAKKSPAPGAGLSLGVSTGALKTNAPAESKLSRLTETEKSDPVSYRDVPQASRTIHPCSEGRRNSRFLPTERDR